MARVFRTRAAQVIEAQCTNRWLNDMGRFEQLTCSPRRRLGGMDRVVLVPGVEIPNVDVASRAERIDDSKQHITQNKQHRD